MFANHTDLHNNAYYYQSKIMRISHDCLKLNCLFVYFYFFFFRGIIINISIRSIHITIIIIYIYAHLQYTDYCVCVLTTRQISIVENGLSFVSPRQSPSRNKSKYARLSGSACTYVHVIHHNVVVARARV